MTMKKMHLTTYWSPEEAHSMLLFLDELRDTLLVHYGNDITDYHRQQREESDDINLDFEDDFIPF